MASWYMAAIFIYFICLVFIDSSTQLCPEKINISSEKISTLSDLRENQYVLGQYSMDKADKVMYKHDSRDGFVVKNHQGKWIYVNDNREDMHIFESSETNEICPTDKTITWRVNRGTRESVDYEEDSTFSVEQRVDIGIQNKMALDEIKDILIENRETDKIQHESNQKLYDAIKEMGHAQIEANKIFSNTVNEIAQNHKETTTLLKDMGESLLQIKTIAEKDVIEPWNEKDAEHAKEQAKKDNLGRVDYKFDGMTILDLTDRPEYREPEEAFGFISLNKTYNTKVTPKDIMIDTNMTIHRITGINHLKKTVGLDMTIAMEWTDVRVGWPLITHPEEDQVWLFRPSLLSDLWTPDPVFWNQNSIEKVKSTMLNSSNEEFAVLPSRHKFMYEHKIKVTVDCPNMNFADFPFDVQKCAFLMSRPRDQSSPPALQEGMWRLHNLNGTVLTHSDFFIQIEKYEKDGDIPLDKAGFYFIMTRKTNIYYTTVFAPCTLMVIVSWVSFAVKVDAIPGRLGLLLTLLLMMINLTNSVTKIIPRSERICYLIGWIWMSIGFVAFALAEYFVILASLKFRTAKEVVVENGHAKVDGQVNWIMRMAPRIPCIPSKGADWIGKIDGYSLIIVPIVYMCSVLIYYFVTPV